MGTLRRIRWIALAVAPLLVAGCNGETPAGVTFTNHTAKPLEVALLGPGVIEPFPPRVVLPAAPNEPGTDAKYPSVSFDVKLDLAEVPTPLSWKAESAQGSIDVTAPKEFSKHVPITRGRMGGSSETPQERIFDIRVDSALGLLSTIRDATKSPSAETWTAVAADWDKALAHAREAEKTLTNIASEAATAGQRRKMVRNLVLTIADGYVRVGLNHEAGAAGADRNCLKAACNYVKADALSCYRVKAIRTAFRAQMQETFKSTFLAHLEQDKVEKQGATPVYGASHRFSSLVLEGDGLHYAIEVTSVEEQGDGKMAVVKHYRKGVVPYTKDLVPGSSITFGDLLLESEQSKAWPSQLRRLWRTLGVLEAAREAQKELDWLEAGGESL